MLAEILWKCSSFNTCRLVPQAAYPQSQTLSPLWCGLALLPFRHEDFQVHKALCMLAEAGGHTGRSIGKGQKGALHMGSNSEPKLQD